MIDTRYPPRPGDVKVELYPSKHDVVGPGLDVGILADRLTEGMPDDRDLVLGVSASALIRDYLQPDSNGRLPESVGVPAFSCQSLVDAVIEAGSEPVFYDISKDTSVCVEAVDYAIAQKCRTFIWPVFFGARQRDPELIDRLHDAGIRVIFDEAQGSIFGAESLVLSNTFEEGDAVVYSFGRSKLLAAIGGGALIGHKADSALQALHDAVEHDSQGPQIAQHHQPTRHFDRQDELLEARTDVDIGRVGMLPSQAASVLSKIEKITDNMSDHLERYLALKADVMTTLGSAALEYVRDVQDFPVIFALRINSNERYDFMSYMASCGIETTWYYYPINRISRYRTFNAQNDTATLSVASSVVILPFQWVHSDEQIQLVRDALHAYGGNHGN